jgi:hypothetical protein
LAEHALCPLDSELHDEGVGRQTLESPKCTDESVRIDSHSRRELLERRWCVETCGKDFSSAAHGTSKLTDLRGGNARPCMSDDQPDETARQELLLREELRAAGCGVEEAAQTKGQYGIFEDWGQDEGAPSRASGEPAGSLLKLSGRRIKAPVCEPHPPRRLACVGLSGRDCAKLARSGFLPDPSTKLRLIPSSTTPNP